MNLLKGNIHKDGRGFISYNNDFDASEIKRIYTIENADTDFVRGWQGHKIEQRWFACIKGSFRIQVIAIDSFDEPNPELPIESFTVKEGPLDFLHIPSGCVTAIQALEEDSKLLVLADHLMREVQDEYRFEIDYFKK